MLPAKLCSTNSPCLQKFPRRHDLPPFRQPPPSNPPPLYIYRHEFFFFFFSFFCGFWLLFLSGSFFFFFFFLFGLLFFFFFLFFFFLPQFDVCESERISIPSPTVFFEEPSPPLSSWSIQIPVEMIEGDSMCRWSWVPYVISQVFGLSDVC